MRPAVCVRETVTLLNILGALSAAGCRPPVVSPAQISVMKDPVLLRTTSVGAFFTVPLVVRNSGRRSLYIDACGAFVERNIGGVWQPVWKPVCLMGLPPGEVRP